MTAHPSTPSSTRARWALTVAALCLGAVGLLGVPSHRSVPPPSPDDHPEVSNLPAHVEQVQLALRPAEAFADPVEIRALMDGEEILRARHTLPHRIQIPADVDVLVLVEAPGRARFSRWLRLREDSPVRVALPLGARLTGGVVDDLGEAVEGALVRVEREDTSLPPWTARTDARGGFDIDTLHAGTHTLSVRSRGHGSVARTGLEPGGARLRIVLERVGSISGRVVDEGGRPRADATVVIAGSGIWPARQLHTDAEGRFRAPDVPPGTYEARAHAGTLVAEPRRGIEVAPDTRVFLTFTLTPGASISGIITDSESSAPIGDAEITVSSESLDVAPRAATSGADGRFRVSGLRRSTHRVSVYAEGYVPVTALEHDAGQPVEIAMTPGGTLVGVVLDADRRPVEGATLEVIGEALDHQPVALTGDRGFRGAVFASQLDPAAMTLEVTEGEVPPIPLQPSASGESELLAPTVTERRLAASHLSQPDGSFRIPGVPPGHVQIVARHPGFAPATTARVYVAAGTERGGLELVLAPAGQLRGRVLDERELGVEGVLVSMHGDSEAHARVSFTDERGGFVFESVVGELSVTARPNGRPAVRTRTSVAPGEIAEVTLTLEGTLHRLYGRTVDERGFPVGGVQVSVTSLRADAPHRATLFSAGDGTFVAPGLPAGPWRLAATAPRYAPATVDVFDASDEAQIALVRGARVEGTLLDDFSAEPVRGMITLVRDDLPPERLHARADGQGHFVIPRARAARWVLHARADGYLSYEAPLEVHDRGRGPEALRLEPIRLVPGGRVEGTVVDALGHGVSRARVQAAERSTRTDARGRFVLTGLAAGHVDVSASHPAAGESEPEDVRILTGRETPGVVLRLPMRLDPAHARTLAGRRQGVAVELSWVDEEARVRRVIEGSHAEQAGLRRGDTLVSIDGREPRNLEDARRLLRGAPNMGAVVEMRRDERAATLHVQREVWLPE